MQTFLPVADFKECARILDKKRVWKQVIEAKMILDTIKTGRKAWANHPVTRMWRGYEGLLASYYNIFLDECIRNRGIKVKKLDYFPLYSLDISTFAIPIWEQDERLYSSHRSNLLRKDPVYYGKFGWIEDDKQSYFWP